MRSVTEFGATGSRKVRRASYAPIRSEEGDEEDHRREEREQRAEGDLLREAHAVVGHELPERSLEDGDPLVAA